MKMMLASYAHKYIDRLVSMGFDTITVSYAVAERGIRAENSETGEVFHITPIDRNKAKISVHYWSEDGWGWNLFRNGEWVEGQSSEDWALLNCLQSIDNLGIPA